MKKILCAVFFAATASLMAGTQNIYIEDWGTTNGGGSVTGAGNIGDVGWAGVATSQTAGPYLGIFTASGPNDPASGAVLPANTVYFTTMLPNDTLPGMFYTTDTLGVGSGGDSSFTDIDPTLYTNLALNVEIWDNHANDTNYFAVRIGTSWYVATSFQLPYNTSVAYPDFTNVTLIYTNTANVWQSLTMNASSVTIGAVATPNLTAHITGIGIVQLPTPNGPDYNELTVTAFSPAAAQLVHVSITAPAISPQFADVGGGASFLIEAGGTPPLTYIWETNGVAIGNDPRFIGVNTNELTITNLSLSDASVTYSVVVTNIVNSATNGGLSLTISPVPAGVLYAENFPFVGPSGNLPITGVGWLSSASANTGIGIYSAGGGVGDVFSYSPTATTNAYYTSDTNDIGLSGLPFLDINPANYPAISFQAGFVPGNGSGQVAGAISVYWAVDMNGTWYCSSQPQAIDLAALSPYQTYQYGFNPAATNWNSLTITGTGAIIGSQALAPLGGDITGAGLIVAHNDSSGSDMNFQNFEIITNSALGQPPMIGTNFPLSVAVSSGGGASFGVATQTGTPPFGYYWKTNGVVVQNGPGILGANTATLTLADLTAGDNNMSIVGFVTNAAGSDESDSIYPAAVLTVTNEQVGFIYSEAFPFVGPIGGNYAISSVGWVEAVVNAPNSLFQVNQFSSQGEVFAYLGTPGTTVYYTTTATDTNQAGLPFPHINLNYPNLTFSVDISPTFQSANVTAYLAVQLNSGNWYVAASPLPVPSVDSSTFSTYTSAFNPAASNWKNLTVTSNGGLIGAAASGNLKGVMTGAGLVFVTVGTGGTFDFANFAITGTGPGGINIGPLSGGATTLTWVGNPAVELLSSTNLNSGWQGVPNTYGLYSLPATTAGHQRFYRLGP
jgi:hypothetical protein